MKYQPQPQKAVDPAVNNAIREIANNYQEKSSDLQFMPRSFANELNGYFSRDSEHSGANEATTLRKIEGGLQKHIYGIIQEQGQQAARMELDSLRDKVSDRHSYIIEQGNNGKRVEDKAATDLVEAIDGLFTKIDRVEKGVDLTSQNLRYIQEESNQYSAVPISPSLTQGSIQENKIMEASQEGNFIERINSAYQERNTAEKLTSLTQTAKEYFTNEFMMHGKMDELEQASNYMKQNAEGNVLDTIKAPELALTETLNELNEQFQRMSNANDSFKIN